jgi:hypothetical protein
MIFSLKTIKVSSMTIDNAILLSKALILAHTEDFNHEKKGGKIGILTIEQIKR